MLNRSEQEKGGFGAFADRERERREARDAGATGAVDPTPADAPAASEPAKAPRHRMFRSIL